ncbi:class I SAM-dependent methyltransferase [Candidatus Kaiserbacteria bacterium]|nr:class I SAM-dependent methyltransferase [Candidatus Kaiserbacteria bacterium]
MRSEVAYFDKKTVAYRAEYDRVTPDGHSFRIRRQRVLEMIPRGDGDVLDLASGPGVMVDGLLEKGYRVTCTDAAPEMIERAKEEHGSKANVSFMVGDAYGLDVPAESYDIVTAMGLIEYLDREDDFLTEVGRILKPRGTFIVTYPNYTSPWRAWNRIGLAVLGLIRPAKVPEITHREYTARAAARRLQAHGFEVVDCVYYNFRLVPYPLDRWFPRLTVIQSRALEFLARTVLGFLGTGFILKARKK